jgi:SpoIIAA-like
MKKIQTVKDKNGILINSVSGKITSEDIAVHLINAALNLTTIPALWDFTDANIGKITYEELLGMAKKFKPYVELRSGVKTAVVANHDLPIDMMRILNKLAEINHPPIQIKTFREIDKAKEWLSIPI